MRQVAEDAGFQVRTLYVDDPLTPADLEDVDLWLTPAADGRGREPQRPARATPGGWSAADDTWRRAVLTTLAERKVPVFHRSRCSLRCCLTATLRKETHERL